MIPAIQKTYDFEPIPEREKWEEYRRLKIPIMKKARTHEEYERMNRELLDELGL